MAGRPRRKPESTQFGRRSSTAARPRCPLPRSPTPPATDGSGRRSCPASDAVPSCWPKHATSTNSDGRMVLGIGDGTKRMISDWQSVADTDARALRIEELVPLIRRIWNLHDGPARHQGRFYTVNLIPSGPVDPPTRAIPIITAAADRESQRRGDRGCPRPEAPRHARSSARAGGSRGTRPRTPPGCRPAAAAGRAGRRIPPAPPDPAAGRRSRLRPRSE